MHTFSGSILWLAHLKDLEAPSQQTVVCRIEGECLFGKKHLPQEESGNLRMRPRQSLTAEQ